MYRLLPLRSITSRTDSPVDIDKCVEHMNQLVDEAAEHIKAESLKLRNEGHLNVEKLLVDGLRSKFPHHVCLGKEGSAQLTDEPTWIIDSIDEMRPELAVCHNPMLDMRFTAGRHCDPYLNGSRLRVSEETKLERALIMNDLNSAVFQPKDLEKAKKMLKKAHALRSAGSAAMDLCLVAMEAADGYYELHTHLGEVAAGMLLVQESGGMICDPNGVQFDAMRGRVLAAATPQLGEQMVKILSDEATKMGIET